MPEQRPVNAAPRTRWHPRTPGQTCGPRADGTPRVESGVYLLTRRASVQFRQSITVRVIRERTERRTYHGWTWVDCYVLDARGDAIARRELFVMPAGLQPVVDRASRRTKVPRNAARAAR